MIQVHDSNPAGLAWTKLERSLEVAFLAFLSIAKIATQGIATLGIALSSNIQMSGLRNSNSAPGFTGKNLHDVIQLQHLDSQQ